MDTNKIKRFATEARNILKTGIAAKIMTLGFDRKGNVAEEHRPQLMQGGTLWNGQFYTEGFYHQWMSLFNRVQQKGINEVYEEAAYTWFNRLCAIRILQKNNLCSPVRRCRTYTGYCGPSPPRPPSSDERRSSSARNRVT